MIYLFQYKIFFILLNFSLKDTINDSSTSSDERVKEQPVDLLPKTTNRLIDNDLLWHR
jgi:hypothetical protein